MCLHHTLQPSSAAYVLSVRLYTYRNYGHRDSGGGCCDRNTWPSSQCNDCDNIFTLCLRGANIDDDNAGNCPLGRYRFRNYHDYIDFPRDEYYRFYSQEPWQVSLNITYTMMYRITCSSSLNYFEAE